MIKVNGLEIESFIFPGGEVNVRLPSNLKPVGSGFFIYANITSSDELIKLAMVVDAIHRNHTGEFKIFLCFPYFPYARQDRVCNKGESFSLYVAAKIINDLEVDNILIFDPHSHVLDGLIDRNKIIVPHISSLYEGIFMMPGNDILKDVVIVSPDAGAEKKVLSWNTKRKKIFCYKKRNPKDGTLSKEVLIQGDVKGKDCLIVDDICDGGRTFINLGNALKEKGAKNLYLYVTYGIFSNGFDELSNMFNKIMVYDFNHDTCINTEISYFYIISKFYILDMAERLIGWRRT